MEYCPECGKKLIYKTVDGMRRKACDCGFVDWDNWVNVAVATVAFNDKNEFLMVRLKNENKLTFPGGYRDLGETLKEAAIREMREESGFKAYDLKLINAYTMDSKRLIWIAFKAKLGDGKFAENDETYEANLYSKSNMPPESELRGPLTVMLMGEIKKML